jgi:hypothetical protein
MRDVTPRRESRKPRTERLSRQRKKPFDKGAAFAATRREIERHAKYVGAGDTDDFYRWLIAWVWFCPDAKDLTWNVQQCAWRIGRRGLTVAEAEATIKEALRTPRHMKADDLARWLGVKYVDRQRLRLTRIGSVNVGKQALAILRQRARRLAEEVRRRAKGARPRAEYEANSLSKSQPWRAENMSKAKWYRLGRHKTKAERKANGSRETSPWPAVFFKEGVHVVVSQREAPPSASPPEGGLPRAAAPPKKGRGLPSSRTAVTVAGHACVADPQPEPCPIWAHQRLPMELRLLALGLPVPENLARAA